MEIFHVNHLGWTIQKNLLYSSYGEKNSSLLFEKMISIFTNILLLLSENWYDILIWYVKVSASSSGITSSFSSSRFLRIFTFSSRDFSSFFKFNKSSSFVPENSAKRSKTWLLWPFLTCNFLFKPSAITRPLQSRSSKCKKTLRS